MSVNTSEVGERSGGRGRARKALLVALLGVSFFVFVAGSFVLAFLVLLSTPVQVQGQVQNPRSSMLSLPGGIEVPSILQPSPVDPAAKPPVPTAGVDAPSRKRLNILLLGIDQRDDQRGVPTRSDTMMVVSVDQASRRAAMVSFARDMWVEIPGYADNRINVANFLGDAYKYPGGGPVLAGKTIEQNFGLRVDFYARIDFRGFEKIVDTLGGVDVEVENAIRDDEYPTEDYETMSIYIPAGHQHMNGTVALQYARSRHSENDFGRARRQQKLLLAIRDRAMQLDVIPKLPSLMSTMMGMVHTDIPPTEFLRLANVAKDIGSGSVSQLVIDEKLAPPYRGEGGADLLMPNKPAIRRAIAALLADPIVQKEAAKIEVMNGTGKSGLATKAADCLLDQGLDVAKVSSADRNDYRRSKILAPEDKKGTANLIASALKLGTQAVVVQSPPAPRKGDSEPDIQVILGLDYTP